MKTYLDKLNKFDRERKLWLFLSFFVAVSILGIIFDWSHIEKYKLQWTIGAVGIVIAMTWWYWTMRVIRYLLQYKEAEHQLLSGIIEDIQEVKDVVKSLKTKD